MGIQKDAGELLVHVYNQYAHGDLGNGFMLLNIEDLVTITKWDRSKLYRAIAYLDDMKFIKTDPENHQLDIIYGMTPDGINTIENKEKFEKSFGFRINLGIVGFNWNVKEK